MRAFSWSFPSLGVTLPMGITPGRPSNQPWPDRLLAAHGPRAGVLAGQYPAAARAHHAGTHARHAAGGCAPGMGARGWRNRLAGVRVAAGRFWPGLPRLVMSGKHWLRNVAAA